MIYFCYFAFLFLLMRLLVAFTNFLSFRYLSTKPQLINKTKVSILIPARNEENVIGDLLNQLNEFSYEPLEIIIYNDNSTDKTLEVLQKQALRNKNIRIIEGKELATGWLGKNYACHQLALHASGEVFLFLDADVSVKDGLIEQSLGHLQKYKLHLLSIFPKQIFKSLGEKISVPLMNWILLSFLPMILIRLSKKPAFSAANGQFMLFRADTYRKVLPHSIFRLHKVEDIAIIKHFKEQGLKSDTLLGNKYIQCRMYAGLTESVNGFTKNIFQFFGSSIGLTIFVGALTTFAPIIIFLFYGTFAGILYLTGIVLIRIFVSLASKQSIFENIIFLLPQHLVFLLIIVKGIITQKKKELLWKGRNILKA
jgi:glycosyltransferase involved in cell wall biosynthesis